MLTNKEINIGTVVYLTEDLEKLENEAGILSKFPLEFNTEYTICAITRFGNLTVVRLEEENSPDQWYSSSIFSTSPYFLGKETIINNKSISDLFEEKVKTIHMQNEYK